MVAYPIPTLTESEELLVAAFRALFPQSAVGARRSYHRRRAQWVAMALTELHAHLSASDDDKMPDSATGAAAEGWGGIVRVTKKPATPARGANILRVLGDVGSPVPQDAELFHPTTGVRFKVTSAAAVVPAEGEVDVSIVGIDAGSKTRLTKGEVLQFSVVPAGLEPRAELQRDLDQDGADGEQEAAFKRRYLDAFGESAAGGNAADWKKWMTALAGIEQAFSYDNRAGRGTLDVVALHAGIGAERALTDDEAEVVLAALKQLGPSQLVAQGGSLRHLTVVPDTQDIEIKYEPYAGQQWDPDWNDQVPPEVDAWDPDTLTLTFTDDRPASMKAGDRICVHGVASEQTGEVLVIESLVATDGVKLEKAPKVAFEPTDVVYAGGPLTAIIRDAILAHVGGDIVYAGEDRPLPAEIAEAQNTSIFELKILAEGVGPANPGGKYGPWIGGLVRAVLESIATYTKGVRRSTCSVPANDYEATDYAFPDDQQIGLVVPGEVLVRRWWP